MSQRREKQAADMLVWYLRKLWERSGLKWDSDNDAEVRGIVEDIVLSVEDRTPV